MANIFVLVPYAAKVGDPAAVASFILWAPGMTAATYGIAIAQADGAFRRMNAFRSGPSIVALIVVVLLYSSSHLNIVAVGLTYSFATVLAGGMAFFSCPPGDAPSKRERKDLWAYGRRNVFALLASTANGRVDQLVLAAFAMPATLGFYAVSATAAGAAVPLCTSVSAVAFRRLAIASAVGDAWAATRKLLMITFLVGSLWSLAFIPFAGTMLHIVYGAGFDESVAPAQVLAIGSIAMAVLYVLADVGRATGAVRYLGIAEAFGAAVTVAGIMMVLHFRGENLYLIAASSALGYGASALMLGARIKAALAPKSELDA